MFQTTNQACFWKHLQCQVMSNWKVGTEKMMHGHGHVAAGAILPWNYCCLFYRCTWEALSASHVDGRNVDVADWNRIFQALSSCSFVYERVAFSSLQVVQASRALPSNIPHLQVATAGSSLDSRSEWRDPLQLPESTSQFFQNTFGGFLKWGFHQIDGL